MLKRILILLLVYSSLTRVDAFTDTGNGQIFIPANKNLGLGIKNTNSKLTINGNIAIKETTRPNQNTNHGKLYVNGTTSNLMFLDDNNNQYDLLTVVGGGGSIGIDTLDGLDSSQFLRSDTSDQFTSGTLTIATGTNLNIDGELAVADTNISLTGASTTFTATGAMTLSPAAGTNLNINTSGAGDLAVNTNQFYVDSSTSNIGLGNTSPVSKLDVRGTLTTNGFAMATGAANNYLLKTDAAGNASWADPNSITVNNTDTLDGIDSNQFLRSDTSDQFTSGTLTTNTGTILRVNGDSYFTNHLNLPLGQNIVLVKGLNINGAAAEDGFRIRMKPAYINSIRDAVLFEKLETDSNYPGGFAFSTTDRNGTQANAFTISGSGDFARVGINEKNPQNILQARGFSSATIALGDKETAETGWREFALLGRRNNGSTLKKWSFGNLADKSLQGQNLFYIYQYTNNGDQFVHPTNINEGVYRLIINDNGQFAFGYNDYDHVPAIFDFAFNGTGMLDSALTIKEASRTSFTSNYGRLYTNGTTSNLMFLDDSGNQYDLLVGVGAPANNATTVDGIDSLQFLRSDTSDVFTSGTLTIKNGTTFRVNGNLAIADNNILFNSPTGVTFTPEAGQSLRTNTVSTGDFAVNNNQLYFDTSASRIGIGFNNPNSKLTVNGNIDLREITATTASSNTGELFVQNNNSELYFDADDQNALQLTNNGVLNFASVKIDTLSDGISDDTTTVFLGKSSGKIGSSYSVAVGIDALKQNDSDSLNNIAIGYKALTNNNNGDRNIAIGYNSITNSQNASDTIGIGYQTFYATGNHYASTGTGLLAFGSPFGYLSPLLSRHDSYHNSGLGYMSFLHNHNGSYNTAAGTAVLASNYNGDYNSAFGYQSLGGYFSSSNTSVGYQALFQQQNGQNMTAIGNSAIYSCNSGNNCNNGTALGYNAYGYGIGVSNQAREFTHIGYASGMHSYSGTRNTGFGSHTSIGWGTGYSGTKFDNGTFLGYKAGYISNGDNNTIIGSYGDLGQNKNRIIAINSTNDYLTFLDDNRYNIGNIFYGDSKNGNLSLNSPAVTLSGSHGVGVNSKLIINGDISLKKSPRPNLSIGYGKLYVNGSSSNLMFVDDSNNEYNLLAGVGGSDANTLDFLDSTQFLRSDTSDQFTSGTLTTMAGTNLRVNGDLSIADNNISLSGASTTFTGTGATTFSPNAGSNLNFNLSGAGNFAVNTNQLFVNSSTGNIGAGTNVSNEKLTIENRIALAETTRPSASANYGKLYINGTTSNLMLLDDAGVEFDLLARSAPPSMPNQDTIDGIDSSQFLRSDISDTLTSGTLAIGGSSTLRVNGDIEIADSSVVLNGPSTTFYSNGPFALATGSNTNLNITVSGAGDFSVNGNKLFVNGATNNTGINL
ncbi:MAG: hypothetical protein LW817_01600, partial [Candidatus Caenarcaniphilales bacterium]|nr:hypothetical protein [Candidatus Caenarcaniphilales bacterium]